MFAPGVPEVMGEFESQSKTLAAFVVSVYVLGFAAGPMLFAPLSEIYGRLWIYHGCNLGFTVFLMASSLSPNMNALIIFRFFSGFFGSTPLTNGIYYQIFSEPTGTDEDVDSYSKYTFADLQPCRWW